MFNQDEWLPLMQAWQAAQTAGNGIVVTYNHTTVENEKYGIVAGKNVTVVWTYLGRIFNWENMLNDEMQDYVIPATGTLLIRVLPYGGMIGFAIWKPLRYRARVCLSL